MHQMASRHLYKHLYITASEVSEGHQLTPRKESVRLIDTLKSSPALSQLVHSVHITIRMFSNHGSRAEIWIAAILMPCSRIRKVSIDTDLHGLFTLWQPALIFDPCRQLVLEHLETLQLTNVADDLDQSDEIWVDDARPLMSNINTLPRLRSLRIDHLEHAFLSTTPNLDLPLTSLILGDALRKKELAWFLKPCISSLRHPTLMQHICFSDNPARYNLSVLKNLEEFTALCDSKQSRLRIRETEINRGMQAFLWTAIHACRSVATLQRLAIGYLELKPGRSINDLARALEHAPQSIRYLELRHVAPREDYGDYESEGKLWQWAAHHGRDRLETIVIVEGSGRQTWARDESADIGWSRLAALD